MPRFGYICILIPTFLLLLFDSVLLDHMTFKQALGAESHPTQVTLKTLLGIVIIHFLLADLLNIWNQWVISRIRRLHVPFDLVGLATSYSDHTYLDTCFILGISFVSFMNFITVFLTGLESRITQWGNLWPYQNCCT